MFSHKFFQFSMTFRQVTPFALFENLCFLLTLMAENQRQKIYSKLNEVEKENQNGEGKMKRSQSVSISNIS